MVKAMADVVHLGAVGMDGQWLLDRSVCLGGISAQDWLVLQNETLHQRTAAALKVTRPGTADAIPDLVEVMAPND